MQSGQSSQLLSILLLLLIVVGSVVFVLPMRKDLVTLKTQEAAASGELQALDAEYAELSALSEQVAKSESVKEALLKAVPVGYEQDALILELSDLAEKTGFTLNSVGFSLGSDEVLGNTLSVTMNVSGSYASLVEFLQKLETADRLLKVSSLSVQRTGASSVSFNLQIDAYYQ